MTGKLPQSAITDTSEQTAPQCQAGFSVSGVTPPTPKKTKYPSLAPPDFINKAQNIQAMGNVVYIL
jgi:hypothetical protein